MPATINISENDLQQAYDLLGKHMAKVITDATETGVAKIVQKTIQSATSGNLSQAGQNMYSGSGVNIATEQKQLSSSLQDIQKEAVIEQKKTVELTKQQNKQLEETYNKRIRLEKEKEQLDKVINAGKAGDKNIGVEDILNAQEKKRYEDLSKNIKSLKVDENLIAEGMAGRTSAAQEGGGIKGFVSNNMGMMLTGMMMGPMSPLSLGLSLLKKTIGKFTDEIMNYQENLRKASIEVSKIYTIDQQAEFGTIITDQLKRLFDSISTDEMLKGWGFTDEAQAAIVSYMRANVDKFDDMIEISSKEMIKPIISIAGEAKIAGLTIADYTKHILDMKYKQNISSEEARARILQSTELEKKLNLEQGTLISGIQSTNDSLATMGFRISDSTGLMTMFGKAVQEGKIGMGDIVNYAKGLSGADEGGQVFLLQRMAENGNIIAQKIVEKYGNDPLAMSEAAIGAFQGSSVVAKDLGVNARSMSRLFREGQFGVAKQMAGGGGGISELAMMRKMLSVFNMELPENIDKAYQMSSRGFNIPRIQPNLPESTEKVKKSLEKMIGPMESVTANLEYLAKSAANVARNPYSIEGLGEYQGAAEKYIQAKDYKNLSSTIGLATSIYSNYGEVVLGERLRSTLLSPSFLKELKMSGGTETKELAKNIFGITLKDPGVDAIIKLLSEIKNSTSSQEIRTKLTKYGIRKQLREQGAFTKMAEREASRPRMKIMP